MKRLLLLSSLFLLSMMALAGTITVKNINELRDADKNAKPGDIIILSNGEWKDVEIKLSSKGTKEQPVTFMAQTSGSVLITGHSSLKIGGEHLVIKGLYFQKGYAGNTAVIEYRLNKNQLANNCRVTECAIIDFNNPKRMNENYWITFYGKNNRLDNCTFSDKKNMGVLIAVILDDERSRENFHSIDHNFFNGRPPLASNSGEIIRVGVSQHCQFNSNTQITDNYFLNCDGETEIVSIKSGSNVVKNNLFKECQGGVVLRHGDNNTVENNIFLGNYKEGTGGVRVINKGQWVVNNFFYACRGIDFRSPLSVMNGIPNSPAHRYVQVTDAVIANNTFYNCTAASFCEGSDAERTLPPDNVYFANNIFFNNKDSIIYRVSDDIKGFAFNNNMASKTVAQVLPAGFNKTVIQTKEEKIATLPVQAIQKKSIAPDSLQQIAVNRIGHKLPPAVGFGDRQMLNKVYNNALNATGAKWLNGKRSNWTMSTPTVENCDNAEKVYAVLARNQPVTIVLTAKEYTLDKPFAVSANTLFHSQKQEISFITKDIPAVFMVNGRGELLISELNVDGSKVKATSFICSDTSGPSNHYNLAMTRSNLHGFDRKNGCESIYFAYKSTVADSIVFRGNKFTDNNTDLVLMTEEKDDKGYYNAEKIVFSDNDITTLNGRVLSVYRGGNDESTMGPKLLFTRNNIIGSNANNPLISLTGVQQTRLQSNNFSNCNPGTSLILYKDIVRAHHFLEDNRLTGSGKIDTNEFVIIQ